MLVKRLLDHFDAYTLLHIDVNDVRDQLLSMGIQDEIRFHFVKMDSEKIRALLYRYTKHTSVYGEPVYCSEIVISNNMGEDADYWTRLAAVKELLHIADCPNLIAQSEDSINHLFEMFSVPPELRNGLTEGDVPKRSALNDRIRIYLALAILIPESCRSALRSIYPQRISPREIADIAKVPVRFIPMIMKDDFEEAITTFLDWEKSVQP